MAYQRPVKAAIFDMDGLLIDTEPFWQQAELEIFSTAGLDISLRDSFPETTGLRIDQVVSMWFEACQVTHLSEQQVADQIFARVAELIEQQKPLMPGVREALTLCHSLGLKIGLASASPLSLIEMVLELFSIRHFFNVVVSAEDLPYSKPHPQVYLNAASELNVNPLHCVALEDSLNGMVAAKAARMRVLVVPAASEAALPVWSLATARLDSLNNLTPALLGVPTQP
ncbi:hexitol phosphatase HxpB [Tatumella citrea]|uniref:2-deoxyglucose-6-phosphatase n=1 Tax=Tatumella citrea TaxID=53336 RepID=A0A1Y0L707_TATCI|nr:hexitol phosphatase HxpB [Tatumella citrea]ARU93816.1 2-deoxyglucose-6-phosphatase [Tatumella citrea]ARU97854.1 2-deoxyglucose-6-phosphatase [Tatumella citrea]